VETDRQLRAEIERLDDAAARLGAELSALSFAQARTEADTTRAHEECAQVTAELNRLAADNAELERVIARMEEVAGSVQLWSQHPPPRATRDNGTLLRLLNWLLRRRR